MINVFISIFIAVLIGVGFIGPIANVVNTGTTSLNATGGACTAAQAGSTDPALAGCQLYLSSTWGASTLKMVPGFYSLVILGVVVGGLFVVFRQVGIQ